jgi:hypothetical protein
MQPASSFPAFTGLPCNSSDQGHQGMTVVPGAKRSLSSLAPASARLGSLAAFAILTILLADSLTFICSYFWAIYCSALESTVKLLYPSYTFDIMRYFAPRSLLALVFTSYGIAEPIAKAEAVPQQLTNNAPFSGAVYLVSPNGGQVTAQGGTNFCPSSASVSCSNMGQPSW